MDKGERTSALCCWPWAGLARGAETPGCGRLVLSFEAVCRLKSVGRWRTLDERMAVSTLSGISHAYTPSLSHAALLPSSFPPPPPLPVFFSPELPGILPFRLISTLPFAEAFPSFGLALHSTLISQGRSPRKHCQRFRGGHRRSTPRRPPPILSAPLLFASPRVTPFFFLFPLCHLEYSPPRPS